MSDVSTEFNMVFIAASRPAMFSVNTKARISPVQGLLKNTEHSEEGYDRGASLFGVGTGAPSINAVRALS
jgi:hypothetical protein